MQHYLVGMEHLILDEVLFHPDDAYMRSIDYVDRELHTLMLHLRHCLDRHSLEPSSALTSHLTRVMYTEEGREGRDERDFGVIRDLRVSMLCLSDVFIEFLDTSYTSVASSRLPPPAHHASDNCWVFFYGCVNSSCSRS